MAGLIKAFAYLRVSGKGQVDGDGFPRQKAAIQAYADTHGIRIKKFFQEEGISGTKDLENRPALQELMIALHSNGVRTVLIEKLDRLARDLMIQESVIADFQRNGFQLISVNEPDLCSDEPTRVLLRQMMGAFAQYERSMVVLKLRSARQRARIRDGRCEGRKPFGEREGEQDIIARIQKLAARGMNYTQIADKLNAEGLPTRANGQWFPATVSRILARTVQP
jgi:DNA invertase Pin-like site-specific DNA recombinase